MPSLRRRRLFLAGLVASAGLAALSFVLLRGPAGLDERRFAALRPGMTRPQVYTLLGGRPGDYGRYADGEIDWGDGSVLQTFAAPTAGTTYPECWQDDRHLFNIFFDDQGRVVAVSRATSFRRRPRNVVLELLRRFGLASP
jgi:hypothetical protein